MLADATYYWQARSVDDAGGVSAWSAPLDFALAKVPAAGPGIGEQRFYGLDKTGLTDRMGISVNPANGNFMLGASDLVVAGTAGMDLSVGRSYNSQSDSSFAMGQGWTMDAGRDVGLSAVPGGSQQLEGPSGYRIMFTKNSDGSYSSPTGTDATLTRNGDGSHKLFFHRSSGTWNFTPGGYLSSQVDMNGILRIAFGYNAESLLATITDSQDRVVNLGYTGGLLATMTDWSGRQYRYGYDSGRLVTYTDPANKNTSFAYDAAGRMTQITDPMGKKTRSPTTPRDGQPG